MRVVRIAALLPILMASVVPAADYLPLREGNQWTFTMSTGVQTTMKIIGFADVGTVRCAIAETTMGLQKSQEYIAVDAEGVKTYMGKTQDQEFRYDPPIMRIKLPYREGDSWTAVVKQSGASMTTTFQSIGKERVETPAGAFDCIKVYSVVNGLPGQPSAVSISYYADGVGPVRQMLQAGGQQMTATLTTLNLQPRTAAADQSEIPSRKEGSLPQVRRPGGRQREGLSPVRPEHDRARRGIGAGAEPPRGHTSSGRTAFSGEISIPRRQGPALQTAGLERHPRRHVRSGHLRGDRDGAAGKRGRPVHHVSAERAGQGLRRTGRQLHLRPAREVSGSPGNQYQFDIRAGPHDCEPDPDGRR